MIAKAIANFCIRRQKQASRLARDGISIIDADVITWVKREESLSRQIQVKERGHLQFADVAR